MATFAVFVLCVVIYIAFLLWCFTPLVRRAKRRWTGWLRVSVGVLLAGANLLPLLAWPILLPIYAAGTQASAWSTAIVLFPRTLPILVRNVLDWTRGTATVVDVKYPITIRGVSYAPVVRTACTTRTMVDVDFGQLQFFEKFPTASGGDLVAQDSNITFVLDQSPQLCSLLTRLKPGPWTSDGVPRRVYLVLRDGDRIHVQEFRYAGRAIAIEDVALQPPEIVRIEPEPARDVVTLDALWPMRRPPESGIDALPMIEAYRRLSTVSPCVTFDYISLDSETKRPKTSRPSRTDYPQYIPVALRPAYCRMSLWWHVSQPETSRLSPAKNNAR